MLTCMSDNSDNQIRAAVAAENITTEVTCPKAQAVCKKYSISPAAFGEYCTREGIKIRACMFGCFR